MAPRTCFKYSDSSMFPSNGHSFFSIFFKFAKNIILISHICSVEKIIYGSKNRCSIFFVGSLYQLVIIMVVPGYNNIKIPFPNT